MTKIEKDKFSKAVRRYREENELTQKELAQKLMTTETTIARWELGISVPKSERMLEELRNIGIRW